MQDMKGFWNSKTDQEIKDTLRINELVFIGKFKKIYDSLSLFNNLRNIDYSPVLNLKSNIDDRNFVKCEILNRSTFPLIENVYYKISAKIISQKRRNTHNNEFLLEFDNECSYEEYVPNEKDFTNNIYNNHINTNNANSIGVLKAVKTITYQINKKNETFIYELLQNADDYPLENQKVEVDFFITDKYLLFTHSGSKFNFNNVYSLCAVNAEDKTDDFDKIGFKGIGFKSVFKANDLVYLSSGNYSFRFEKSFHNAEYPWQLMPIWTEVNDLELSLRNNTRFLNSNVAIALRPRDTSKTLYEYSETLELFSDDRILLFLKNIDKVNVFINKDKKIFCSKNNNKWWLRHFEVDIDEKITNFLNTQISEGNEEIPSKYLNLKKCKISFASLIFENKICELNDAKLFNYLPLSINLNLPFLINADFIPDGEREGLINNEWNQFLLETSGFKFVQFIRATLNNEKRNEEFKFSIFNLIPSFRANVEKLKNNEKWFNYFNSFKFGFETAIIGDKSIAFIPTLSGNLENLSNIIIDETGLSTFLDEEFFTLTELKGKLINNQLGSGIEKVKALLEEYNLTSNIYTINDLKLNLKKDVFQDWLKIPANNFKVIQHFHTNKYLEGLLETEEIILTANNKLAIASKVYNSVPDTVTFVEFEKINEELLNLLQINDISIELKLFNPVEFYNENIWSKHNDLNQQLSNEQDLLNFWNFIYDYWDEFEKEDKIKASLKLFYVLCKSLNSETLYRDVVSKVYIAADFNTENEIESVIVDIGIVEAKFISEKYISEQRPISKWYRIFKHAQVITDLQKVIEILLEHLSTFEENKHFEITKQIFKYWKVNQNKESQLSENQLNLIRNNLKIKGIDDKYYKVNSVIISDHYNLNRTISSILPIIELPNQISRDYGPYTNQIADWKHFFKLINCIELSEKQNVLNKKIDFFVENQDNFKENHFEILKSISDFFKTKKENGFEFPESLSSIKLLTDNEEWCLPSDIHFSSVYKPKLDLQKDDTVNNNLKFLSDRYIPNEIERLMLMEFGVQSDFVIYKTSQVILSNVKEKEYCEFITNDNKYVQDRNQLLTNWTYPYTIESRTYLSNHYKLNYSFLIETPLYYDKFIDFLIKRKNFEFIFDNTILSIWMNRVFPQKTNIYFLINNFPNLLTKANTREKPQNLFATRLLKYIEDESKTSCIDFSEIIINEDNLTLEEALGINQFLSQQHCINILSRKENRISIDEVVELKIIDLLKDYSPSEIEKTNIFLLNENLDWKSTNELFFSKEEKLVIESSQKLHEKFIPIANNFGVTELSSENLNLKTIPEEIKSNNDIIDFFDSKAKFIAFKIDYENYQAIEEQIKELLINYSFYEASSIVKVFPEENPIYVSNQYVLYQEQDKIFYIDNWKTNKEIIDFLFSLFSNDRLDRKWFENLINRWSDSKIIEKLNEDIAITPIEWSENLEKNISIQAPNQNENETLNTGIEEIKVIRTIEDLIPDITKEDEAYIRGIISFNYDSEGQMDANTTAKIKALVAVKHQYNTLAISDEGRYLKAGSDEIIVRSAQNGLLYLDIYHWGRLKESNVRLAVYTNSQIEIYNSQEELYKFTKPQNKFGIIRLPDEYTIEDYNSLDNITDKGKWHYVFIVNENTNAAKNYKEAMNLEDYNF